MPIRVELKELKIDDFVRILIEPKSSLVRQYKELLKTESIDLQFTDDGIKRIAEVSWQVNDSTENIGARRLHTVLEKLLEEISFNAGSKDSKATEFVIDNEYVDKNLKDLSLNEDLSRYIL
jgi:ATP-dependent HslUV protease ATP-binding subunit HslU